VFPYLQYSTEIKDIDPQK